MSEVLWSQKEKNYDEFLQRVENHYPKLEELGVEYGYEKTPIKFKTNYNKNKFDIEIEKGKNSMEILYQINDGNWKKYENPFEVFESSSINAKDKNSKRKEIATKSLEINFHKGIGKKIAYKTKYNNNYKGSGNNSLISRGVLTSR